MNVVGYKDECNRQCMDGSDGFYMNVVGYKDMLPNVIVSDRYSFI